jgi:hypothetical protein
LSGIFPEASITPNGAPEMAAHEYGHAVMYQAYGNSLPPNSGGTHSACEDAKPGLAWSEGFAEYLAMVTGQDNGTTHWTMGDAGLSIEHYSCRLRDMATDELRVTAGLWDLYDAANDNNGGDPNLGANGHADTNSGAQLVTLAQILQTLWVGKQNTINEFHDALRPRLNAVQRAPFDEIMTYNYYP